MSPAICRGATLCRLCLLCACHRGPTGLGHLFIEVRADCGALCALTDGNL